MTHEDYDEHDEYDEFKTGLFVKYHYQPLSSVSYIKSNVNHSESRITSEDLIALKIDAETVLKKIKNRNMAEAFCLMAQGYLEWEVAEQLGLSVRTIEQYVYRFKKYLEKV